LALLISEVMKKESEYGDTDKEAILQLFDKNPNEVFRWREISSKLKSKPETVRRHLHELSAQKRIGRHKMKNRRYSYYGSVEAIRKFEESLSKLKGV
jgi:predicted transcriptional regulator